MTSQHIIDKIISFTKLPYNFLEISERKEVLSIWRKQAMFQFGCGFLALASYFTYRYLKKKYFN